MRYSSPAPRPTTVSAAFSTAVAPTMSILRLPSPLFRSRRAAGLAFVTACAAVAAVAPAGADPVADIAPPTTVSSADATPAVWASAPTAVSLTASDDASGVVATYYTTDGTEPTTASPVYDPLSPPLLGDGEQLRYFSVDAAGNAEDPRTSAPQVDATPPSTVDDVPAGWARAERSVTLTASDATSGVAATYYTTDGTAPDTGSARYDELDPPVLADGEQLRYFSFDAAGNAETVRDAPIAHVDATAPATTDDVATGWQANAVTVTLTATDAESGVDSTHYTIDGSSPAPSSPVYDPLNPPVLPDGEQIRYFSFDAAGNAETVRESAVAHVDAAPPVTTDNVPASPQSGPVTVTLAAADAGSGTAITRYTVDGTSPNAGSAVYDPQHRPVLRAGQRIRYFSVDAIGNAETVRSSATVVIGVPVPTPPPSADEPDATPPDAADGPADADADADGAAPDDGGADPDLAGPATGPLGADAMLAVLRAPLQRVALAGVASAVTFDATLPVGVVTYQLFSTVAPAPATARDGRSTTVRRARAARAARVVARTRLATARLTVWQAGTVHVRLKIPAAARALLRQHPFAPLILRTRAVSPEGVRVTSSRTITLVRRAG
jgi:hypothetical protein